MHPLLQSSMFRPIWLPIVPRFFHILADRIGLRGKASAYYPMLKNLEIEPLRKSRFRTRRVISADSPHGRAYRSVARGKAGRSADPLRNFSSRPPAVSCIVIDAEIRVFQHYRRKAVIAYCDGGRRSWWSPVGRNGSLESQRKPGLLP